MKKEQGTCAIFKAWVSCAERVAPPARREAQHQGQRPPAADPTPLHLRPSLLCRGYTCNSGTCLASTSHAIAPAQATASFFMGREGTFLRLHAFNLSGVPEAVARKLSANVELLDRFQPTFDAQPVKRLVEWISALPEVRSR